MDSSPRPRPDSTRRPDRFPDRIDCRARDRTGVTIPATRNGGSMRQLFVAALLAVPFLVVPGVAGAAQPTCYDPNAQLTVEEQRLTVPVADGQPAAGPELV